MKIITRACLAAVVMLGTSANFALADSVGGALGGARIDNFGLHVWFNDNWKRCGSSREFHYDINSGNFAGYTQLIADSFVNRYQIHIEFYCQDNRHIIQSMRRR
jgi:hypothetical protein